MRRILIGVLLAVVAGVLTAPTSAGASSAQSATGEFLVLYKAGVSPAAARAAIRAAGGTIVRENTAVGLATVRASAADFKQAAARQGAIAGVAGNRPIG
ncbi:MAG TPA: peptidase S8, partial [Actinomycetes bacterium]|nr:peptidase S8 [Actinomycetes bacterium]